MADEAVSEADRLEGFPHPRESTPLVGHQAALETVRAAWQAGRLPGAYLISGPQGIGKATFAYHIARALLRHGDRPPAGVDTLRDAPPDAVYERVRAQAHGNLLVLRRPWNERSKRAMTVISVEEIRRAGRFFTQTANEDGWRLCIVDAADDMNANAANALLKVLEEPPKRAMFLILAHSPGGLLATIRSRCRRLNLQPLDRMEMKQVLAAVTPDGTGQNRDAAITLAGGSAGRALALEAHDGPAIYQTMLAALDDPEKMSDALAKLGSQIASAENEDRYRVFRELVQTLFVQLSKTAATGRPPRNVPAVHTGAVAALAARQTLARWPSLWDNTRTLIRDSDIYNLDRRLLLLQIVRQTNQQLGPRRAA